MYSHRHRCGRNKCKPKASDRDEEAAPRRTTKKKTMSGSAAGRCRQEVAEPRG
jgi:hypothetical protein